MNLLKKIAPLILAGTLALAGGASAQEASRKADVPAIIGSSYGEFSYFRGNFQIPDKESPAFLNFMAGYNTLQKKNASDGALILPNVRIRMKADRAGNPWNNYLEAAIGAAYARGPFEIGVDAGYLSGIYASEERGIFGRGWASLWKQFQMNNLLESKLFPMRPQIIFSGDLEATTLTKGLDINGKIEEGMVVLEKGDLSVLPYAAISANMDTHWDHGWNNYLRGVGGLRVQKGPLFIFAEGGYQKSFNGGNEGFIFYAGASAYLPVKAGHF